MYDNQDGRQNGHHLSISAVVVTLTQSFLIKFLPNFIYGLLPSSSHSSLNTGFVGHAITKMADKMAATYQYPLSWLLSFIFNRVSSKFCIWIAPINLSIKFKYGFCPTYNNQDGRQNGCHLSISAVVVTLAESFLIRFLPNFIYGLLPSTFLSSSNMGFVGHPITKMVDKITTTYQCRLSWSLLLSHFLSDCFQISYMDCFHQTLIQV